MKYVFLAVVFFAIGYVLPALVITLETVVITLALLGFATWIAFYFDTRVLGSH